MKFCLCCIVGIYLWGISFCAIGQDTPASKADDHQKKAEYFSQLDSTKQALTHYERAYQLVKATDPIRAANLCLQMSSLYYGKGDFKNAIQICQKGLQNLSLVKTVPDTLSFKLYSMLGQTYNLESDIDSSSLYFQQAGLVLGRNTSVESHIPAYVLHYYNNHGRLFLTLKLFKLFSKLILKALFERMI